MLMEALCRIPMWGGSIHTDAEVSGLHSILESLSLQKSGHEPLPERMPFPYDSLEKEGRLKAAYSSKDMSTRVLIFEPHPHAERIGFKNQMVFFNTRNGYFSYLLACKLVDNEYRVDT